MINVVEIEFPTVSMGIMSSRKAVILNVPVAVGNRPHHLAVEMIEQHVDHIQATSLYQELDQAPDVVVMVNAYPIKSHDGGDVDTSKFVTVDTVSELTEVVAEIQENVAGLYEWANAVILDDEDDADGDYWEMEVDPEEADDDDEGIEGWLDYQVAKHELYNEIPIPPSAQGAVDYLKAQAARARGEEIEFDPGDTSFEQVAESIDPLFSGLVSNIDPCILENKGVRYIADDEIDEAIEAVIGELAYQEDLERRTADEAKDVPGFLTLARRYMTKAEEAWADNPGPEQSLHEVRKLAAIMVRAMIYCGVTHRD